MINIRRKRLTRAIFLLLGLALLPLSLAADPFLPDTVKIDSIQVATGEIIALDIRTFTDEWLTGLEITIGWDYSLLHADSFSFNPARLGPSIIHGYTTYQSTITLFAFPIGEELIAPGDDRLGTLYLTQPYDTIPRLITFDSITVIIPDTLAAIERSTFFSDTLSAEPFVPVVQKGFVYVNSCCGAYTGNIDCDIEGKRNLSDITRIIDRVYVSKEPLCCKASGNTNGDLGGKLNLADITKLVDHVYVSKEETAPCQ